MDVGGVRGVGKYCIEFVQSWLSGQRVLSVEVIAWLSSGQRGFIILLWIKRL